jgi:hypothetical protein
MLPCRRLDIDEAMMVFEGGSRGNSPSLVLLKVVLLFPGTGFKKNIPGWEVVFSPSLLVFR